MTEHLSSTYIHQNVKKENRERVDYFKVRTSGENKERKTGVHGGQEGH